MASKRLFTLDDVIGVMGEFGVTHVSAKITIDRTKQNPQQAADLYHLVYSPEKHKDPTTDYLYPGPVVENGTKQRCCIEFTTVHGFKRTMQSFIGRAQELPYSITGDYPGGTHPSNPDIKLPILFYVDARKTPTQATRQSPIYATGSHLDAIRANKYRHPFTKIPPSAA